MLLRRNTTARKRAGSMPALRHRTNGDYPAPCGRWTAKQNALLGVHVYIGWQKAGELKMFCNGNWKKITNFMGALRGWRCTHVHLAEGWKRKCKVLCLKEKAENRFAIYRLKSSVCMYVSVGRVLARRFFLPWIVKECSSRCTLRCTLYCILHMYTC